MSIAKRRASDAFVIHSNVATAGVPTPPSGAPVNAALLPPKIRGDDGFAPREVDITIVSVAAGGSTVTGPVQLYGNEDAAAVLAVQGASAQDQWNRIGQLNGGANIVVTNKAAYTERVQFAGNWRALAIGAASIVGQNVTVYVTPISDLAT